MGTLEDRLSQRYLWELDLEEQRQHKAAARAAKLDEANRLGIAAPKVSWPIVFFDANALFCDFVVAVGA